MMLFYDSSVRVRLASLMLASVCWTPVIAQPQDNSAQGSEGTKTEPKYDDTFSGPIVEISTERITVSRSILGKPAEKRSFWIKPDTRVEGKLRMKAKVTVGFVTTDEGDVARLIVVRTAQKPSQEKKK